MATKLFNKGFNGWKQLGVFLGMWGVCLVAGSLAAAAVWSAMTGQGLMNMEHDMMNQKFATAVKMVQLVSTMVIFFFPAVAYAFICYRNGWLALGFNRNLALKVAGISILLLVVALPFIDFLGLVNKSIPLPVSSKNYFDAIEKSYSEQVKIIGDVKTTSQYLLSLIMIALLPAVFEETLFRGGVQNLLSRWKNNAFVYVVSLAILLVAVKGIWLPALNGWFFYGFLLVLVLVLYRSPYILDAVNSTTNHFLFPILLTSILFSAVHASWYGFMPRVALGGLLGLIFYYTKNIWYTILLHFLNNAAVVTYMFIQTKQNKPISDSNEQSFPMWTAIISVVLLVAVFKWFTRTSTKPAPQEVFLNDDNPFEDTIFENKDHQI